MFAWCWADFCNFCVFTIAVDCPDKGVTCPGDGNKQFFVQLYNAIGLTIVGQVAMPLLKASAGRLARVEGAFVHYFMKGDSAAVKSQKQFDDLATSFFGISIGWAWTSIAASECSLNLSPTCPKDFEFSSFLLFGLMVLLYILIAVVLYHNMMESYRLSKRCNLLLEVQDGNAKRIFASLDKDKDGQLAYRELEGYFTSAGLNEEPFTHAFHDLDHHTDGVVDGKVDMDDLMAHFKELMAQVKAGTYHPEESIALKMLESIDKHPEEDFDTAPPSTDPGTYIEMTEQHHNPLADRPPTDDAAGARVSPVSQNSRRRPNDFVPVEL